MSEEKPQDNQDQSASAQPSLDGPIALLNRITTGDPKSLNVPYPPPPPSGPYVSLPPVGSLSISHWVDALDGERSPDRPYPPPPPNQSLKQESGPTEKEYILLLESLGVIGLSETLGQEDSDGSAQTIPLQFKQRVSDKGPDVTMRPQLPVQLDSISSSLVFSCGHHMRPVAQFCPECGKPVAVEVPLWLRSSTTTGELTDLATAYENQKRYEEVESLYLRILAMREQRWGSQHTSVAQILNNLAVLYEDQGRDLEAEPLYQRALAVCEQQLGLQHPTTLQIRESYRFLLQKIGLADTISVELLHPSAANYLSELADFYFEQGKYNEAELLYQRALMIQEKHFGSRHPSMAQNLNNLAALCEDQGRDLEAEPLYQRALAICEQQFGLQHPTTLLVRENYRFLLQKIERNKSKSSFEHILFPKNDATAIRPDKPEP